MTIFKEFGGKALILRGEILKEKTYLFYYVSFKLLNRKYHHKSKNENNTSGKICVKYKTDNEIMSSAHNTILQISKKADEQKA